MRNLLVVAALVFSRCLAHRPAIRLTSPTPITVGLVNDDVGDRDFQDVPDAVKEAVTEALAQRNLAARILPFAEVSRALGSVRDSQRRLTQLPFAADTTL